MATIKVKINGEWQQLPVYGFVPIEDAPKDGKQYARQDGTWSEISSGVQYLDLSIFPEESGTLSDEDYQKVVKAYENGIIKGMLNDTFVPTTIQKNIGDFYYIRYNFINSSNNTDISLIASSIRLESDKSYKNHVEIIVIKLDGLGTKALTDNGQYAEFATPTKVVSGGSGEVTQELSPNTYYEFGECTSLTITLAAEVSGILNEYMFEFKSGSVATTLSIPETVGWMGGEAPTIEANKTYQCSIVNNIAVIGGK